MKRDQVGDEHISTPSRDHISIEQGAKSSPENGSYFDSLDPEVERKD